MRNTRKVRKTRKKRRQKGGRLPSLRNSAIKWPEKKGCVSDFVSVSLVPGDTFDRFGSVRGTNISPTGLTAQRLAIQLGIPNIPPESYSYTERSLPYVGVTNSGFVKNNVRHKFYKNSYRENLKDLSTIDYHQYEVLDTIEGNMCVAAPAFDMEGGAIQIKLNSNIETLLKENKIKVIQIESVPGYFKSDDKIKLTA